MEKWLSAALDYIPQWLEFQVRQTEQPGCVIAITYKSKLVLEQAFGYADLSRREALTPRHRFRVASHSKSFTAAGVMKLCEIGKLRLDDAIGRYVKDLHPAVSDATISQLLSHGAGIIRDGLDAGQWQDRRPFLDANELRADLAYAPLIAVNTQFKYSNHGFGLIGLAIESITGEPYKIWIKREIIDPAGLDETAADMPIAHGLPIACGHSAKLPTGHRLVIPSQQMTNALAPATGFVSTARDLARFFAQIDPAAARSMLTVASRRQMVRRQRRDAHSSIEIYYGIGVTCSVTSDWEWFGHAGGFPGFITRTVVVANRALSISVVCNAIDGFANQWSDGIIHILATFAKCGAPTNRVRDWAGRWWSLWGAVDMVPMGRKVLVTTPALLAPFTNASEVTMSAADRGVVSRGSGFDMCGERVCRIRGLDDAVQEIWLGGSRYLPEGKVVAEIEGRYKALTHLPGETGPLNTGPEPDERGSGI